MASNTQFIDTLGGTSNLLTGSVSDIMAGFASVAVGAVLVARTWQARAENRRHLASIETRLLSDMGMTVADAKREAAKPFWMA